MAAIATIAKLRTGARGLRRLAKSGGTWLIPCCSTGVLLIAHVLLHCLLILGIMVTSLKQQDVFAPTVIAPLFRPTLVTKTLQAGPLQPVVMTDVLLRIVAPVEPPEYVLPGREQNLTIP